MTSITEADPRALPSGTVTFLYTDIEGSTRLWQQHPDEMAEMLALHDRLINAAVVSHGGAVFRRMGDALCAAFPSATGGLHAAVEAQRSLLAETWPAPLQVRMAVHSGYADIRDGDYDGHALNRVARLRDAGHGGQILVSLPVYALVADDLDPSVDLRDLGRHRLKGLDRLEQIYAVTASGLETEFPPLRTLSQRINLPQQPTPFVGREEEVRQLRRFLEGASHRLVTLVGPGGTGKTRLSLHVAELMAGTFPGGVYFVPLATTRDAASLPASIVGALGIPEVPGAPLMETIVRYFGDRRALLLLDNFEQVIDGAPLVGEIVRQCPGVTVVVTSRTLLHVAGERAYPVSTLSLPPRGGSGDLPSMLQSDAVSLFVGRVQAAKPDFRLTRDNASAISAICTRLDGLPLALELAAARSRLFPPASLLKRLENRLPVLTGGPRDLPERQRTLQAAIDWSYSLLSDEDRRLFARLSVFSGGGTMEAIEAVSQAPDAEPVDILAGIESLLDKSLVRTVESDDGDVRISMLETIREFAIAQLRESGEAEVICAAHAQYFLDLAETSVDYMNGPQQILWVNRLEAEDGNLRAAMIWFRDRGDAEACLRMAFGLFWLWAARGPWTEGLEWLTSMLRRYPDGTRIRARALCAATLLSWLSLREDDAMIFGAESRELAQKLDDPETAVLAGVFMGQAQRQQKPAVARATLLETLATADAHHLHFGTAMALHGLGAAAMFDGDYGAARAYLERGEEENLRAGSSWGLALVTNTLGDVARVEGKYTEAESRYREALRLMLAVGIKNGRASILHNLGYVAHHRGDPDSAGNYFREALSIFRNLGDARGIAECLAGLACVRVTDDAVVAAEMHGAAQAAMALQGAAFTPSNERDYQEMLATAERTLGSSAVQDALRRGRAIGADAMVRRVLALD